ncbi:MAG: hypothetical protein ACNS62_20765 [Candidatus Cyclobacteriaceae bacterium M3_2C_046]
MQKIEREYQEKLSHLNDLIQLSRVDGYESSIEINFIESVAERLGVDDGDLQDLKNNRMQVIFSPPRYEYQIIPQFHRLVLLMGIDRMIFKEELNFCMDLGLKLGLNPSAVKEVLDKMILYPNNIIPAEDLESIFKKYYN